jgi:hypothetical protein
VPDEHRDRILQPLRQQVLRNSDFDMSLPPRLHGTVPSSSRVQFPLLKTNGATPSTAWNQLMHRSPVRRHLTGTSGAIPTPTSVFCSGSTDLGHLRH